MVNKTTWEFLAPVALKESLAIINEYGLNSGQISLTHRPCDTTPEDRLFSATGSLYDYSSSKFIASESDFTEFNQIFKDTYLHDIYTGIGNIGRMRIMVTDGPSAYTVHRDLTTRYHLVLQTNQQCFFVFPGSNSVAHIPQDNCVYEVDTKQYHTFVNGSRERRIHLVMDNLLSL